MGRGGPCSGRTGAAPALARGGGIVRAVALGIAVAWAVGGIGGAGAAAGGAASDPAAGLASGAGCAGDLPSERLALYCALAALHAGAAGGAEVAAAAGGLGRLGFGGGDARAGSADGSGGGRAASGGGSVAVIPRLVFSENVNGGNLPRDLWIGTLLLARDPAFDARPGVLIGAQLRAAWREVLGEGRVLDLAAGLEELVVPDDGARVSGRGATACLGSHLGGWWFADLCASHASVRRALGRQRQDTLGAGVARLWSHGPLRHETRIVLERHRDGGGRPQARLGLGLLSARAGTPDWARLRLMAGAPQPGTGALRLGLGAELATVAAGRRVTLSADYARHGAVVLLGVPLAAEERFAVGARVALGAGVTLELGWEAARGGVGGGPRGNPHIGVDLAGFAF